MAIFVGTSGFVGLPSSGGAVGALLQGGNAFGAEVQAGATDAFPLRFLSGVSTFGFAPAGAEPTISIASFDATTSWWLATGHRIDLGTTDNVLYLGWNVGPGGSPVNALMPRLWDAFESSYNNGVSIVMERHVGEFVSVGGVGRRPLTFAYDLATNDVSFTMTATGTTGVGNIIADRTIGLETNSAGSSISLGATAHARACNFGTGAAAQTCSIGSPSAGSSTTISCESAAMTMAAGAVSIACTGAFNASGAPTADLTGNGMRLRLSFGTATFAVGSGAGEGISFASAGGSQYNLVGAGGVTKLLTTLALTGPSLELSQFLWLRPSAAPAAPADGWEVYSDIADSALKAKNSGGFVTVLAP